MNRVNMALAACCMALALAGCGSSDSGNAAAPTSLAPYTPGNSVQDAVDTAEADRAAAAAAASSANAAAAAASRSAAAAAAALQQPGATVNDGRGHTVTYYSIQQPAAPNAPEPQSPGTEWVAIDVQVCYGPGAQTWDNSQSWVLVDANNGNYDPSSTGYSQFPSPEFPWGDIAVIDGQCIRGWIVYDVVIGADIVNVAYMPYGATRPVTWAA
jgi:hypothetical protein